MSGEIVLLIIFVSFIAFLLIGVPIAISIGLSATIILIIGKVPLVLIAQRMFAGTDSFALIAVPFFILAGDLMSFGQTSKLILDFVESLLGFMRGALWPISTVTSMIFAGISGSGAADTAAVASAILPELEKRKYDRDFSAALIASAGSIGIVIPPSVPMVLYAFITYESVGRLFLNGFIPGILMGLALIYLSLRKAIKENYEVSGGLSFGRIWRTFKSAFWGLMTPVIILGGIFSGYFTPSEAAVIAVDWAVFVSLFIYRDKTLKDISKIIVQSVITASLVMFLIATARIFAWVLANWRIPLLITQGLLSFTHNKYLLLFISDIILIIAGIFLETASIIIIFTPIFLDLMTHIGVSPLHFGIIEVIALAIGMVTPPVAINLYIVSGITGIPIEKISRAGLPLVAALFVVLLLVTYIPLIFPEVLF